MRELPHTATCSEGTQWCPLRSGTGQTGRASPLRGGEALGGATVRDFRRQYEALILQRIAKDELKRDPGWTEAIAVGSEGYVREM